MAARIGLKCAEKLKMYHKQNAWDIGALSMSPPGSDSVSPSDHPTLAHTSVTLVHSDILGDDPCSLLLRICEAAKTDPKRVLFVWGPPPCTTRAVLMPPISVETTLITSVTPPIQRDILNYVSGSRVAGPGRPALNPAHMARPGP